MILLDARFYLVILNLQKEFGDESFSSPKKRIRLPSYWSLRNLNEAAGAEDYSFCSDLFEAKTKLGPSFASDFLNKTNSLVGNKELFANLAEFSAIVRDKVVVLESPKFKGRYVCLRMPYRRRKQIHHGSGLRQ